MRHPALLPLTLLCTQVACDRSPPVGGEMAAMRSSAPARARHDVHGPEHDVYSLVDNRLYAHVERGGGLVVLPGAAGFPKYLTFGRPEVGWGARETFEGHAVARVEPSARLGVPLDDAQAAAGHAAVRVYVKAEQEMTLLANGRPAPPAKLVAGWQTVSFTLPPGALHAGENDLTLSSRAGAERPAVEWLQIGGTVPATGATAPSTFYDPAHRALVLADGSALTYYLAIPPGARLVGHVTGTGCKVDVSAQTSSGKTASGALTAEVAAIDLGGSAGLGGEMARLRLRALGCPSVALVSAALAVPGPRPVAQRWSRPRNIVLWIMDSLRADKVRAFTSGARPETPVFTALAERGVLFTAAYAPGNESRESYGSVWTGVYPANHGMTVAGQPLDPRLVTLAPALRAAGLRTVGATGNGYIAPRWGFGDGWDAFTNRIHDEGSTQGDDILGAGLKALAPGRPFFLYLGTVDTHVSWRAKRPWLDRYDPGPYDGAFKTIALGRDVERIGAGQLDVSDRDKQRIIALYDSNVSFQDDLLGKLVADLEARGEADSTMLVITADHGDELWEDGRVGHGASLRETLVHVPLLVVYPPLFPPRTTVTEEVELVDLLPTLLDAAGASAPEAAQGTSLVPLAHGLGTGYPRGAVATQLENAHALLLFGWKALTSASGIPEIYHVAEDPLERQDLAATRPIERRLLTDVLAMHLRHRTEWRKGLWGAIANVSPQMADDLER